jgi:hypothetical protein
MPKLFCTQLRDRFILRHDCLPFQSSFVLTMLLYTRNLIPKIPDRILGKHCQIMFLRTLGSRRPPTISIVFGVAIARIRGSVLTCMRNQLKNRLINAY